MTSRCIVGIAARTGDDAGLRRLLARLDEVAPGVERCVVVGRTVAEARNVQADRAIDFGAETLVFVDTDQFPARDDWFERLTRLGDADVVSGPVVPVNVRHPAARWLSRLETRLVREIPRDPRLALNCNSAFRVAALGEVRRRDGRVFDETLSRGGEDWDLDERLAAAGARFRFEADAPVLHDYAGVTWRVAVTKRYRYCVAGALVRLRSGRFVAAAPAAAARATEHVLEVPVKAAAAARALLLHYAGV